MWNNNDSSQFHKLIHSHKLEVIDTFIFSGIAENVKCSFLLSYFFSRCCVTRRIKKCGVPVDLWIYGRRPMKECRSLLDIATTQITITRILRFMFNCSNVWVRRPGVSHTPTSKRQLWRSAEVCRRHHCARMWHKYLRSDMVQRWSLLFGFVGYGIGLCLCFLFTPYMFFVVVF